MSLELLRFLALTLAPSITAAARPALTFFSIQLVVFALVTNNYAALPTEFAWLIALPTLAIAGVLAGLETLAKHDADVAAILRDFRVDNVVGAFGAFTVALLFAGLGMPVEEAAALSGSTPQGGLLEATSLALTTEHSSAVHVGAIGGAVGINLGLTWLRGELLEYLDDFELGHWWARLETGGTIGVLLLLPLLPLFVLAFVGIFAVALSAVSLAARAASGYVDARSRKPCGSCGHEVRREASVCPKCGEAREPEQTESGWNAALRAVRARA